MPPVDYLLDLTKAVAGTFVAETEHHTSLGSTNDRARECALAGNARLPLLVVADEQTAGRGRGTNRWWTGRGSLAMSLLLDTMGGPGPGPAQAGSQPLVGLAAAVAVVETARPRLPGVEVGLHWPNDVFASGRKLAGVLVEVLAGRRTILGIGVNTNNTAAEAPPEVRHKAVTMRDLAGRAHDPTDLLSDLLRRLEASLARLAADPAGLGCDADRLCLQRGREIAVRSADGLTTGRCQGIASDGAMLLATRAGLRRVYSGVVVEPGEPGA